MQIVLRSHHATVSDGLREKALRAISKLARRLRRPIDADVVFEQDGPTRRVEIVVRAPRHRRLVAEGSAQQYGAALQRAIAHLAAQTQHAKRPASERRRRAGIA